MNNDEVLAKIQFIIEEFKFTRWMMNNEEGFTEIQFIMKEF